MTAWPILLALLAQPPAAKPVWTYQGKPLVLQPACGAREMEQYGLECSADEPCPLYLELTSIDAAMLKVFVSGNLHTESATIAGLLLMSEDEGKTWSDATARIPGATLEQIQFAGLDTGFVSGHTAGTLLKDPFFLKSSDGGRTWEKSSVFEETAVGIIESFWFDTTAVGTMVVDRLQAGSKAGRWQKYETRVGGSSWTLLEVSPRPLSTRRPKGTSASEAWRLRADGAIKAHRIEKKEGSQWRTVATFATQAGACAPEPSKP